jgi:hypothetical protein
MKATVVKKENMGGLMKRGYVSVFKSLSMSSLQSHKKYRLEGIAGKLRRERDVGQIQ